MAAVPLRGRSYPAKAVLRTPRTCLKGKRQRAEQPARSFGLTKSTLILICVEFDLKRVRL